MWCPNCEAELTRENVTHIRVDEKVTADGHWFRRRRRRCMVCGKPFSTYETMTLSHESTWARGALDEVRKTLDRYGQFTTS